MNPEIEPLLEDALSSVGPTLAGVTRVSVLPDYESALSQADVAVFRDQLLSLLQTAKLQEPDLSSHEGQPLSFAHFPALAKFALRISLHGGSEPEMPWVDITPPGNWI